MNERPLWTVEAMAAAMQAGRSGPLPRSIPGISIDTRTIAPGEAFFGIRGENRDGHDFVDAAYELGMNHAGEIAPLARLVRPQVAIITAIEPVHLEFFASVDAIADAKAEIFSGIEPGGAAVINRDNLHFARLKQNAQRAGAERVVGFGEHADADARLIACSLRSEASDVEARIFGTALRYRLGAP